MHELPLKLKYTPQKGFTMQIAVSRESFTLPLPEFYVKLSHSKDAITCTTLELLKLNQRIKESMEEIFLISDK